MGIGVEGLSEEEKRHRDALRRKVLNEARPYSADIQPHIIPGLGPRPETPVNTQVQIKIPAESSHAVVKKIVRGCEYWLASGRIVESPYGIDVFFPTETPEDVRKLMATFCFGPRLFGTGIANPKGRRTRRSLGRPLRTRDVGYTDRLRQHSAATHGPFDPTRYLTRADRCPRLLSLGKTG
jgi:hypothetical protein